MTGNLTSYATLPVPTLIDALCEITVYSLTPPVGRRVFITVGMTGAGGTLNVALVITPVLGAVIGRALSPDLVVITTVALAAVVVATQLLPKSLGGAASAGLGKLARAPAIRRVLSTATSLRMKCLLGLTGMAEIRSGVREPRTDPLVGRRVKAR